MRPLFCALVAVVSAAAHPSAARAPLSQTLDTNEPVQPIPMMWPLYMGSMSAHLLSFFGGHGLGAPMEVDAGRHPIGALMGPTALLPGAYLNYAAAAASADPSRPHFEELSWANGASGSRLTRPRGGVVPDPFSAPLTPLAQRSARSSGLRRLPFFAPMLAPGLMSI